MTAVGAAALGLLAGPARADPAGSARSASGPLAFTVTSVSPGYAEPGHTITIKGMLRNTTASAMPGLSVNVAGAQTPLNSMAAVQEFAAGTSAPLLATLKAKPFVVPSLAAHAVTPWTVQVPVSALGLTCFGVYPLAAQVSDAIGTQLTSSHVPLVFWPRKPHGCQTGSRPRPARITWIWPLIDSPHQGPCHGVLLDNSLAASVRPGGRLYDLLAAASRYVARGGKLTWAIDPALLDSLALMKQPYQVGQAANCGHASRYPANSAATAWLRSLMSATAKQTVFVTPYADVDIAALIRHGSDADLSQALADGQQIAHRVLGRDPVPAPLPVTGRKIAAVAWPAGGIASTSMLETLAAVFNINTVILAQPASSLPYAPGAFTQITTGAGLPVNVLQANDALSQLLRSPAASSRQPAAIAGVSQQFLAETAVNIAENPSIPRPIVVTPPRHWNPAGPLSEDLLTDTAAPWLTPANASQLVGLPPQHASGPVSQSRPRAELPARLLAKVDYLSKRIRLLESIFESPDPTLRHAVFGIESSWWRSRGGARRARSVLGRTLQFVSYQFGQLSLGGNKYVTLGGRSGSVVVSVRNGLSYPVRVNLRVQVTNTSGSVSVTVPHGSIPVLPGKVAEQKLSVHATQNGQAVLHFSLISPGGVVLPRGRLTMQVRASNFGRIALIICGVALAVFVLASAARAIRHGRPAAPEPAEGSDRGAPEPQAPAGVLSQPSPGGHADGSAASGSPPGPTRPGPTRPGSLDPARHREGPDSVVLDQSDLTPAGPAAADRRPSMKGRRPMEETR